MLIPRKIAGQMVLTDNAPFDIQNRIQQGCNDGCGWSGDPFLIVRAVPRDRGRGWAVMFKEPGSPAVILYRTDREQPIDPDVIDHRAIVWLQEARKNYEQKELIADMLDKHDAQVQREQDKKEIEMSIEVSKMVGAHLRKEGKVSKKHKIDRRKD